MCHPANFGTNYRPQNTAPPQHVKSCKVPPQPLPLQPLPGSLHLVNKIPPPPKTPTPKSSIPFSEKKYLHFRSCMSNILTQTQISALENGKGPYKWPEEDIQKALALASIDRKAYEYFRLKMKIPLPTIRTINRRIEKINVQPGILKTVLRLMSKHSKNLTDFEKICILSFDEMKIDKTVSYDKSSDTIYDAHNYVQVALIRSITSNWKQPIFYNFDCPMTVKLLREIINELETIGFKVHAIVSDLGPTNQRLFKELNVDHNKPYFINPNDPTRKIHVFCDVPHLLKLIRNNLIDNGIESPYGFINIHPIKEALNYQSGDLKLCPKLSQNIIYVKGIFRQKVKLAAYLLSESTHNLLEYLGSKNLIKNEWKPTSKFVKIIDQWFDIMNSSKIFGRKDINNAFRNKGDQLEVIQNVIDLFSKCKCRGKLYPFMKGVLMSSKSLLNLFSDLNSIYGVKYIMTSKLNQDVLEEAFGVLRQMGAGAEHPAPVSFKYRIRRYILSRSHLLVSAKPNTKTAISGELFVNSLTEFLENSSPIKSKILNLVSDESDESEDDEIQFEIPENENDAFDYVLGFVAFKYKKKYNFLDYECDVEPADWIRQKSRGYLSRMDPKYRNEFMLVEKCFRSHHGESLKEEANSIESLYCKIGSKCNLVPPEVIKYYIKLRIYYKIRILNKKIEEDARRKKNKMSKITK